MLVIHDDKGMITQVIIQAQCTLDELSQRYAEMGIAHLMHDGDADIAGSYVRDGKVLPKEQVVVAGELRPLRPDGVDVLTLAIEPRTFTVTVLFDGKVVHEEHDTTGVLALSVNHAGLYTVFIDAGHPYQTRTIEIEAIA